MNEPTFPRLRTLDDLLPAIAGRPEFILARRDGYTVVDYAYQVPDTFGSLLDPDPAARRVALLRREARGLKFAADGRLLARAWPKFFNLNEKEEVQAHRIDWSQPHWVLEKLDGSMVHPALFGGRLVLMTMMGVTPIAEQAMRHAFAPGQPYEAMARALLAVGWLPIFEWCTRQMQVIVDYPVDRLVLTGVRRQEDGVVMPYPGMVELAAEWGVPVVGAWNGGQVRDVAAFVAHTRGLLGAEGYVVRFASGLQLKLKADDYVQRHAVKGGLSLEKNVLALVLMGKDDDQMPLLPPGDRAALARYAAAVRGALAQTAERFAAEVAAGVAAVGGDRKRFATEVAPRLDKRLAAKGFECAFGGGSALAGLTEIALKACHSGTRIEAIRDLLGGLHWADFWNQPFEVEG